MDATEAEETQSLSEVRFPVLGQEKMERGEEPMTTTSKKTIHDLDYREKLRPSMLADDTIDLMFEDGWGKLEDCKSPEERAALEATREYCLKYLDKYFIEGGAWEDLGSLSISLCMFYDGYLSKAKGEVGIYN
jgi:hypothetical protein